MNKLYTLLDKLNGWQRIGFIVSVSWFVFAGFMSFQYQKPDSSLSDLGAIFLPIIALWVFPYLLLWTFRWVVKGFKKFNVKPDDPKLNKLFIEAINNSRLAEASRLIELGANPNIQSSIGTTLLMSAAQKNDIEICKFLINCGASIDIQNNQNINALDIAEIAKSSDALNFLLNVRYSKSETQLKPIKKYWKEIAIVALSSIVILQAYNSSQSHCYTGFKKLEGLRGLE